MTRDDIKAALLKVYPEAEGPEFDALLQQLDTGNVRGDKPCPMEPRQESSSSTSKPS
jgi:hypothetical protein